MDEFLGRIATAYRRFAQHEAHGRSPLYEQLANEVAHDQPTLDLLSELSPQATTEFALRLPALSVRHPGWLGRFPLLLKGNREQIRKIMLTRRNEPARCATGLVGKARQRAEEYVRRAPRQIGTAYRRVFARILGSMPLD